MLIWYRVWGIRPAKVCEASKLQSLFGASRLKASKPQSCKASLAPHASKPLSSKASLAPHASKPQSLKAAKPLWRLTLQSLKASKPERLDALALWRLAALSGFGASWRFSDASKPQSLKAWTLGCCGALALWRLAALARFGASWRFSDASKPQSLNAWMLWRFGACPTPQSLKAWTLGCFGALALGALDALVPLGPLALCGSLTLWRFGAWRSWCFGASWPFGALRLFDALALLGALRLRGSVTLWHFAALWDMPSWEKSDFVDFTFFSSTDWNIGIKAVSEKKQRARLFVFEGQRSPAASELTTTCLVIFVGCLMMVYLSRWLTSVVCKSPFRGS